MTMRIYVGTYAKYNNGDISGQWLNVTDYDDKSEFIQACLELHDDEDDPELMFQDWEGIPEGMIGECWVSPEVWALSEAFDDVGEDAVRAYLAIFGEWDLSDFQGRYHGEFDSWEDMVENLLEEQGALESIPENLRYYFDYDKYARDMRYGGDMVEHEGHYFWNH